jgi:sulfopropanediol 3-dehydrogenase
VPEYLKKARPVSEDASVRVRATVAEILGAVQREGLSALRRYSAKFDGWEPESFRVSSEEIARAEAELDPELRRHIDFSIEQVRGFAERQHATMSEFEAETLPGVWLGQKHIPIAAVGAYSPGGRYALIASSIMSIAVPKVAGVPRVVAAAPPRPGGGIHPPQLYAMAASGADEILCLGGVQALAALAYGFEGFEPVDFVVGAGNQYVTEGKRQIFGPVGIDLLAGPSEVLVIADETANPELIAIDLLGQAEHGPNSPCWLATTSREVGAAVLHEIDRWLEAWPTAATAGQAWADCGEVILCRDDEEMLEVANRYAAEHIEVHTEDPGWYLERLRNYGSLFLTPHTTVAYGDKAIGTNHILPTGRAGRYTGGLWVGKFLRTVTYQRATPEGSRLVAPAVAAICAAEEMRGHAITAEYRLDPDGTRAKYFREQDAKGVVKTAGEQTGVAS